MQATVYNLAGEQVGNIDLDDAVFGITPNMAIVHQAVLRQQANARQGTHETKTRAFVSGGGKKPWRQKGTGRARQGSTRSPQWRHGAVIFGPTPRSHEFDLPKGIRKLALKTALSAKQKEGRLIVLDAVAVQSAKTKDLAKQLGKLGWSSVLVIDGPEIDGNFERAARNIPGVDVLPQQGANVYDIVRRDTLVLTRAAITALEARL